MLFSGTSVSTVTPTIYYQDARGHIVAEYGEISNSSYQTTMALQLTADPVQSLNVSDLQSASTVTAAGDNYASISYKLFRDAAYASLIRATTVLMGQGQRVDAKQVIDAYNKALDYSPYEQLIQIVYNAMYPSLKTPQPPPPPPVHDESFWVEFIEIVVTIVVMVVAHYYIGPALFGAGYATATGAAAAMETGATYAVAGALADAASQGVAIAFDDEHGFNLKEMVMSAITTGATAGAGKYLGFEKILSDGKYLKAFSEIVATNITVQLFQMSIGLRPQLDLKLAAEQAIAQVLSSKIDSEIPTKDSSALLDNGVNEITTTGVNTAFGAPFNTNALVELAGNYVGDIAGDEADVLAKQHTAQDQSHSTSAASMSPTSQSTGFNTQAANDGGSGYGNRNWNGNGNQSGNGNWNGNTSNDSGINALYQAYEAQLSGGVSELANANYSAYVSSAQSDVETYQTEQVQRSADRVARNSSGFFSRAIRNEIDQDEFTGKIAIDVAENLFESGVGLAKMGYHLAEMTPYQTYIGLRAAATTSYHFAEALLNPETRMGTLDAAGKGIGAFGIGLATKFEDLSPDEQAAEILTLGVAPETDAVKSVGLVDDAARISSIQNEVTALHGIAATRENYSILHDRISSRGVVSNSGTVKVYRVEGDVNQRLLIDSSNNVTLLPDKNTMLFLNFGQQQRALDFLAKRENQLAFFPKLRSFDLDANFLLKARLNSVPQRFGRLYPEYAQISDPTKAADQFGIPASMFDELRSSIRPGSGATY